MPILSEESKNNIIETVKLSAHTLTNKMRLCQLMLDRLLFRVPVKELTFVLRLNCYSLTNVIQFTINDNEISEIIIKTIYVDDTNKIIKIK